MMKNAESQKGRLITVLGMHRSGTSAITRGLHALAIELGNDFAPGASDNEKGFWEDRTIVDLNTEVLRKCDADWHTIPAIPPSRFAADDTRPLVVRAIETLRTKMLASSVFAIKDPRITRLLTFWKEVFQHLALDVAYVITVRHPMSVAQSLKERDGFDREKCYYLWLAHVIPSMLQTEGSRRIVVDYDLMMNEREPQLKRLAAFLELTPRCEGDLKEYVEEFLDDRLRHNRFLASDADIDSSIPKDVTDAYAVLTQLSRDELSVDAAEVHKTFARLARGFNSMAPAFDYITRLERRLADATETIAARDRELGTLSHSLDHERKRQQIDQGFIDRFAEREAALAETQALAIVRAKEIESLLGQWTETEAALSKAQALAIAQAKEIELLAARLTQTDATLSQAQGLAVERAREIASLSDQLARTESSLEKMRIELAKTMKWSLRRFASS